MLFTNNKREKLLLVITYILIFARDMQIVDIPFTVFSLLGLFGAILLSPSELCTYIICLVPFCRALPYSELILISLCTLIIWMFRNKKKLHSPILYVIILFLASIELLGDIFWNQFTIELIYMIIYLAFVSLYIGNKLYKNQENVIAKQYILSTLLALSYVIIREINTLGWEYIMTYNVRFGANIENIMATNFNSNEMGLYAIIGISLALILFTYNKKVKYIVVAIALTLLGVTSISRTFMLLVVCVWMVYLLKEDINIGIKLFIFGVFLLSLVFIFTAIPDVTEWIQSYFKQRSMESGGRVNLVSLYFNKQFSSIFGVLFGFTSMYMSVLQTDTAVHNGFQEMMICWGIIGAVAGVLWVLVMIKNILREISKERRAKHICTWIPLFVFLLYIQVIQFFSQHNYVVIFVMALIGLVIKEEGDIKDINERKN